MTSSTIIYDNLGDNNESWDYFVVFILFLIAWRFFLSI
jgi:hypothetical protein